MTLEKMQEQLGMDTLPEHFPELYAGIAETWRERSGLILGEAFLEKTLSGGLCLTPWRQQILEAAARLRENAALCLLVCLLEA